MADAFDGPWLKWGRGVVHAQSLDREVTTEMTEFDARHPYTASTKYEPKRHCVSLRIDSIEPIPGRMGLILGDVANNFRSCLDQLAWTLVTTRGVRSLDSKHEGQIYFPFSQSSAAFDGHLVPAKYLSSRDRGIIRRFQPFWNTAQSRLHAKRKIHLHCLSVLANVNRDDKHRNIRPVWAWPTGGKLFVGEAADCSITRIPTQAKGIVLQEKAEIQRVYVRRTGPNPDVYLEAHLSVHPTIDGRVYLQSWLGETISHIKALLERFSDPPDEIYRLGIVNKPG